MSSGWVLQVVVTGNAGKGRVGVMSFPIMQQSSLRGLRGWNVRVLVSVSFLCVFSLKLFGEKKRGVCPLLPNDERPPCGGGSQEWGSPWELISWWSRLVGSCVM